MTFRAMLQRLWALTVRPLLQCRRAPTEEWGWVTEVDVLVRYATSRAWRSSSGRRLARDRLTDALFNLRCYRVWQMLDHYGGHFWFNQDTTTGHRCTELHCVIADGFEIFCGAQDINLERLHSGRSSRMPPPRSTTTKVCWVIPRRKPAGWCCKWAPPVQSNAPATKK